MREQKWDPAVTSNVMGEDCLHREETPPVTQLTILTFEERFKILDLAAYFTSELGFHTIGHYIISVNSNGLSRF